MNRWLDTVPEWLVPHGYVEVCGVTLGIGVSFYSVFILLQTWLLQVLQELTAKERGDWTPLMAAAGSGSVECFQEVLRAIAERTSEERVSYVLGFLLSLLVFTFNLLVMRCD